MPVDSQALEIKRYSPVIGAEIRGVDLNELATNPAACDLVYEALIKHQVIFFRDQELTPEAHMRLARSFGEPEPPHPVYPHVEGWDQIVQLKSGQGAVPDAADWHKDVTFRSNPPFASLLHQVVAPSCGGDTLFLSASAAYDALSAGWKLDLKELEAVHDIGTFRNDFLKKGGIEAVDDALKRLGSAVHKVVSVHPVTKKKYLNVNTSFTRHIVGIVQGESDRILQFLFNHLAKPEFNCRFQWERNSVAIWYVVRLCATALPFPSMPLPCRRVWSPTLTNPAHPPSIHLCLAHD